MSAGASHREAFPATRKGNKQRCKTTTTTLQFSRAKARILCFDENGHYSVFIIARSRPYHEANGFPRKMESKPGHVNTVDLICGTGFGGSSALLPWSARHGRLSRVEFRTQSHADILYKTYEECLEDQRIPPVLCFGEA